jgi:hypothetical protein
MPPQIPSSLTDCHSISGVDDPLLIFMAQDSLSVTIFYVLNVSKNYVSENKTASFISLLRLFYIF